MTLDLRKRILLTLVPLLVLLAVLGSTGVLLLHDLSGRIDLILKENYESVVAMERLNEALERIDSSFQFALAGEDDKAQQQFADNWPHYKDALHTEKNNITLPGERERVEELEALSEKYRRQADAFFAARRLRSHAEPAHAALALPGGPGMAVWDAAAATADPHRLYFNNGLLATFTEIKSVSKQILLMNQQNMKEASSDAKQKATTSLVGFAAGLVAAGALATLSAWVTIQNIIRPIRAVTHAAQGIRAGNLDQLVPYPAHDELGDLAAEFNLMARSLRDYRQSHSAQLLRVQRTSQATINSFPDPVLVIDTEGAVEMANPAAQRLLGVIGKQAGQAPAPVWQPPASLAGPLREAINGRANYRPQDFDHAVVLGSDGDGSYLPRVLTIHDPYGHPLGAAVLLQDVTRFRLLDQVKTDLVATVSHELKTPLTSLRLDLHLLLEEAVGPLTAKQTELLLDARDGAERLLAIVDNLLNLARLEERRQKLERKPEVPAELLRSAAEAVSGRAQDKGVEIYFETEPDVPPITVDAKQLAHALGNLLDNAVTYTDRGGRITLAATQADGMVTMSISDNGVGIPAEHLPHVFERFFRVPGQSRGQGTGLGLAIAREVVTAQGGTITCESTANTGTTFRLRFPAASPGEGSDHG